MRQVAAYFFLALLGACTPPPQATGARPFRLMLDQPPATLIPRATLDATGQRLGALLFRALTRIDADLNPTGDLAESWTSSRQGTRWAFRIRKELKDHAGAPIDATKIAACLEQYRAGKPLAPVVAGLPHWSGTSSTGDTVTLELNKSDPYLPRNVSLLRYFTSGAVNDPPCREPRPGAAVVTSGAWRPAKWDPAPESSLLLLSETPALGDVEISFVRDETTRTFHLLRGDTDAVPNLRLGKTKWLRDTLPDRFTVIEREGVNVSYLAFNLRDAILAKSDVRRAIALGIDRESVVRHKMNGAGSLAGSFLSPLLPESAALSFPYDPVEAEKLLDRAGYPRKNGGVRLELRYKTTPIREGLEQALIFKDMLAKIGVELVLDVVEPAVFLASMRQGKFQLCSSRWVGVADGHILYRTLRTGQSNNRVGYSNPEVDRLLDAAYGQERIEDRIKMLREVQARMMDDLPYFPLWFWTNAVVVRRELTERIDVRRVSLSGALEPLLRMAARKKEPNT